MSLAPLTPDSARLRLVDDSVLLQRLLQSLEIGTALQVAEAPGTLAQLRAQTGPLDLPADLGSSVERVLTATEKAVRAERPQWAVAIREELALLHDHRQRSAST